jgi:hypothetical protein
LKGFPHFSHTNDWVILMRALVVSPLSGGGLMLDADIYYWFAALYNL